MYPFLRIMEVLDTVNPSDILSNWRTLVGGKGQCLPDDEAACGDGGPATAAQLTASDGMENSVKGRDPSAEPAGERYTPTVCA